MLNEFVRDMGHERSGLHGFTTMGKEWVSVRDSVRNNTLRPRDAGTGRVSANFDLLVAHVVQHLRPWTARTGPDDPGVGTRVLRFFSYFTIQSNLFVLASTVPLARNASYDGRGWRALRLDALVGVTVTGAVYALVLAPTLNPVGIAWWTNATVHYVAPVVTVVGWLLLGPRPRIGPGTIGRALVWPAAWIGYILALGAATGWYPYPFMDFADLGYVAALRNLSLVVVVAVVLLLAYARLDAWLPRTDRRTGPRVN